MKPPIFLVVALALVLGFTGAAAGFAFAQGENVNLDQWANSADSWQNGDLNGSNSSYTEGDVVPFRAAISGLTAGTHTIHLNWDVTSGTHAAYDFLASYNATEAPGLCAVGGGGVSGLCPTLPTAYALPLFTDDFLLDGQNIHDAYGSTPRVIYLYGVSSASFGTPTYSNGGHYTGDVLLTFVSTGSDVLLAWGGHIARTSFWTPTPQGAGMLSGASWHMRTQSLDEGGGANQDRSIQTGALPNPVISVLKYNDLNGDGNRDAGEAGLAGWVFDVYSVANNKPHLVDTITTGSDGTVSLTLDTNGTYSIVERLQSGWANTDPGGASASKTIVAPRGVTTAVEFGNRASEIEYGNVSVYKYSDANSDGAWQSGEIGQVGWTFTVKDAQGVTVGFITTDSTGIGTLAVPPGTYSVCEDLPLPDNWTNTQPGGTAPYCYSDLTVAAGGTDLRNFGNHYTAPEGTLRVFKYNDLNGDHQRQLPNGSAGEPGLAGWQFTIEALVLTSQQAISPITTGADPLGYASTPLPTGTYSVCEIQNSGWTNTDPGEGLCKTAIITVGQTTDLVFGNHQNAQPTPTPVPQSGTLQVGKYNDTDRDGVRDGAEAGLAGWTFQVRIGATLLSTLVTDSTGLAAISLAPGTYTVTEVMQTGWTSTDPGGATPTKTAVVNAGQLTGVIFGNALVIIPPTTQTQLVIVKYADSNANGTRDSGEGVLSGFTFTVTSSDGAVVRTAVTGDDGTATILNLPLATYTITETPRAGWVTTDPSGNAQKTVTISSSATSITVAFGNAAVRLPSTATDDGTTGMALTLLLVGGLALMFVMARRASRPS